MNKIIIFGLCMILLISFCSAYELEFYHSDHLGSPVVVTDESGAVVWSSDYDVFGASVNEQGDGDLKYNQKERDDTGLLYYGARYYNADTGRFITADTVKGSLVDSQSQNLYVYVQNNPMKYIDPTGNQKESSKEVVGSLSWAISNLIPDLMENDFSIQKIAYKYASSSADQIYRQKGDPGNFLGSYNNEVDILAMYLGLESITLDESSYKPTSLTKYSDLTLYSISEYTQVKPFDYQVHHAWFDDYYLWGTNSLKHILNLKEGDIISFDEPLYSNAHIESEISLGHHTESIGRDEKGVYLSIFDVWDFGKGYNELWNSKLEEFNWQSQAMALVGNPIGLYDRYYLDESAISAELDRRANE